MSGADQVDRVAAGPFLSATAWLCLLPGATKPSAAPEGAPPGFAETDPAKEAREALPLTRAELARAFAGSPVHRALLAVEGHNPGINGNIFVRFVTYSAPRVVLFACTLWPVAVDSGEFIKRGIVTGFSLYTAFELAFAILAPVTTKATQALRHVPDEHPFACYARWRQLYEEGAGQPSCPTADGTELGPGGGTDPLVRHDPLDDTCTCPAAACSRSLVDRSPDAPRWRAHAEVLARFEAAARADLARMFGFAVDWGVVRGLLATGLTLGVGLFGILRGAGVGVTIQSVCPA